MLGDFLPPGPRAFAQFWRFARIIVRIWQKVVPMAHYRKSVAAAVGLNTGIFIVEAIAGYQASSLSLIMDSLHNLSDELALICIYLAFIVARGPSQKLLRSANVFNSVGLIAVSGLLLWQVVERMLNPVPVHGIVPVIVGLAAAAANWGVARLLLQPSKDNAAIRLAYIHNLGDVWVSLAPVLAGVLLIVTGYSFFDPLIAGAVALWIIVSTGREVLESHEDLIWPEKIACCHPDHDEPRAVEG
jgi:cobalt-zinc-cadmium efflux system protein